MPGRRHHPGTACGDSGTSAPYVSRLINKKDGIVNKIFVDMLDKPEYDIQLTYVKRDNK